MYENVKHMYNILAMQPALLPSIVVALIWSVTIKFHNSADLIIGLIACYKILAEANITPIIHQLDNKILNELILVIKKKGLKHHVVTAQDHRQNPVERAISTIKKYLILCL